ncbi:MAG: PTS sugar transporter subunit IIC [Lachnospiraceae bacterium]|nr:PTS sugar transporter subunit IIC [Lachnospiraceae bacterium]
MQAIQSFMEKYFVPVAAKIGSMRVLIAVRDAFVGTLPVAMAGSIAVMINAIIRDMPGQFNPDYDVSAIPVLAQIVAVNGFVWQGTLAVAGIIFAISWGYNLSRVFDVDGLAGALVSLATLIMGVQFAVPDGPWGWLPLRHLGAMTYFTTMLLGGLSVAIYIILIKRKITIKLPDSVPPAISKAFTAIIPAAAGLYAAAIIYYIFSLTIGAEGTFVIDWISEVIAAPLLGLSQGYGAVALITFLVSLFWFFGLHGPNVLAPILEGIWGVGQLNNLNAFQEGGLQAVMANIGNPNMQEATFLWVRGSFDAYAWFGGSGGTITLILAIFLFSKRADYKTIAKLGVGPGIFNINEPVMFGLPIVLNPIMLIPFILAPLVATTIGYLATIWGLVAPVTQSVTWVMPPFLLSFLATAGDWRAPIVTLVAFAASFVIWAPFVIAANSQKEAE